MMDKVVNIIFDALRALCAFLCEIIYPGIATLYELFTEIGTIVYAGDLDIIYNKISLIIGIFMVFRVTFWLIESLINPDTISDKEKNPGKIVQKVLISVVLLAITPTLFETAFDWQQKIVESQIIEKIVSIDNPPKSSSAGKFIAAELFINFYTPAIIDEQVVNDDCTQKLTGKDGILYENLIDYGKLDNLNNDCLTKKQNDKYVIDFNGLFATAVGGFVFWMILMYCISVGARYAQLIYLQIIAPIPIMCYLTPNKDSMFSKWLKQCTTTYLDLFIRIAIINFVMVLCNMLLKNGNILLATDNMWVKIFLVLGLLIFAKKAPELIQELLPKGLAKASGDFGLSLKKRTDNMFGYKSAKRAIGFGAGGITGAAVGGVIRAAGAKGAGGKFRGAVAGAASGFLTGSKKGNIIKNIGEVRKNQAAQNSKLQQWRIAAGKDENAPDTLADSMARRTEAFKKSMGFETKATELKRDTEFANQAAGSYKNIIDFGSGKALEKNRKLTAFGDNRGIAELDAIQKSAATEYQSATVENLMTTDEGRLKLKNITRELNRVKLEGARNVLIDKLINQKGLTKEEATKQAEAYVEKKFNEEYNHRGEEQRIKDANMAIEYLRNKSIEATQKFEDNKKQAGFLHLVEEFALGQDQNIKNEFKIMEEFLQSHPEIATGEFGLPEIKPGEKYFDAKEMEKLRKQAEDGDIDAQAKFNKLFKSFDKFKTLKSIYVAKNAEQEALRDKANDQYNGK